VFIDGESSDEGSSWEIDSIDVQRSFTVSAQGGGKILVDETSSLK
jgi:hypothetical protein